MNDLFGLFAAFFGGVTLVGLVALLLCVTFNRDWDWPFRVFALGVAGLLVFVVGFVATERPSPLSRGIVGDKQEREYTVMVPVGKVLMPQHHHDYLLVSTEGATCSVTADVYPRYQVGDAVVCGWLP